MIAKTDQGKKIRKYYVKLENIYNELIINIKIRVYMVKDIEGGLG